MIERLYVDNYKSLVNFELPLKELTLLIGRNGVGKTSVLDIVFALRRLLSGEAKLTDKDVFPTNTLTRWQLQSAQVFEVDVRLGDDTMRYRLEVEHDRDLRRARILSEKLESQGRLLFAFEKGKVHLYRDDYSAGPEYSADWTESALARVPEGSDNRKLSRFLQWMRKTIVCGLYPASFEAETVAAEPVLYRDARNLASWYQHVMLERPDLTPSYLGLLSEVIEGFKSIRLVSSGLDSRAMMVQFVQGDQQYELRLSEMSDGQRALTAIYALSQLTVGQGYTLFLDEPDNYVALAEIQPWLVNLSDACGEDVPQAVICSHHPEVIDYIGRDRCLELRRENSGVTKVRPLRELDASDGLKLSELVARGWL